MKTARLLLLMVLLLPGPSASAEGSETARLVRNPDLKKHITSVKFKSEILKVEALPKKDSNNPLEKEFTATIEGQYQRFQWNLLKGVTPVPSTDKEGSFRIEIPITERETSFELLAVSPLGEIEKEKFTIQFPAYADYLAALKNPAVPVPKLIGFNFGVGLSYIVYTDTRPGSNQNELGITPKISYSHTLGLPWLEAGANVFITALPFAETQPVDVRFLGANARIGFILPKPNDPWKISLSAGYYFTTMFVNPANFGFVNMQGPQLYPAFRYLFKTGATLGWYAKYSPVVGNGGFLNLLNAEVAGGISYAHLMKWKHYINVGVDVAYLNLINVQNAGVNITALSTTASVGYSF
ncbi:MAG: hypothetical protein ACXWP5_02035 [Bdellovibrionota bacterium]